MPLYKTAVSICLQNVFSSKNVTFLQKVQMQFWSSSTYLIWRRVYWIIFSSSLLGETLLKSQAMKLSAWIESSCTAWVPWRENWFKVRSIEFIQKYAPICWENAEMNLSLSNETDLNFPLGSQNSNLKWASFFRNCWAIFQSIKTMKKSVIQLPVRRVAYVRSQNIVQKFQWLARLQECAQ